MKIFKGVNSYKSVWMLSSLFVFAIIVGSGWHIYWDYRSKYDSYMKESQSQARIVAEHASRTLGEIDRALDNVMRDISKLGKLTFSNEKALYEIFVSNKQEIPQVASFFIIDSGGILRASSISYPVGQLDLSDREYVTLHKEKTGDTPFISRPFKNKTTGKWIFVFSQRLNNPDGSFAGIIGASCDLAYFESLYATLFNSTSRRIGLVRDDGYFIVISPASDRGFEVNIKNGQMLTNYLPKNSVGSYRNHQTTFDKTDRLIAFSKVPGAYPLVVQMSYEWNDLFSKWKKETFLLISVTLFFAITFMIFTYYLVKKLRELAISDTKVTQLSRAVEQSPVSVVITDTEGLITYVNPKFSEVTGYSYEEAIGQNPKILKTDITPPETYEELWRNLLSGSQWRGEFFNKKKNGRHFWEMAYISPVKNAHGETTHFVAVKEDITDRKKVEEKLKEQSINDDLTGLNNRRGFNHLGKQQIKIMNRNKQECVLVYADLDGLKLINDTFGHDEGDNAICDAANILKASFRSSDIIARLGGDEFVALSIDSSEHAEELILERLLENLENHNLDDERPYKLSISFGFARYKSDEHNSLEELLKRADQRMYEQKLKKNTGR